MLAIKTAIVQQPGTSDASYFFHEQESSVQAYNQARPGSEGLFPARIAVQVPQSSRGSSPVLLLLPMPRSLYSHTDLISPY